MKMKSKSESDLSFHKRFWADDGLNYMQKRNAIEHVIRILENIPSEAFEELLQVYGSDLDALLIEMYKQTVRAFSIGQTEQTENLSYLESLSKSIDEQLKIVSYNYFKASVLSDMIEMEWRNLEWGNIAQLYPNFSILAARGHGKSFEFAVAYPLWRLYSYQRAVGLMSNRDVDNKNRKETLLTTNTFTLGKEHLAKIAEEIKYNDILKEKLNPTNKASLGATEIETETGSKIHLRSMTAFGRGLHVGAGIVDDFPDDSSMYSKEQREKVIKTFAGVIKPSIEPGGTLGAIGTPYHKEDLYGYLRKNPMFKYFEYPCIYPDGKLLSPDRFTIKGLLNEKKMLGSIVFTREYMVVPVSDDSTIFPWEYLSRAFIGMERIGYVDSIRDFPLKLKRVAVGADFAKSANVGADYTVYTVWGIDSMDNYYLLHRWKKRGASYEEQVNNLISLDGRFKPNVIVCEDNGFQGIISDMVRARGLKNVQSFTTTSKVKKGNDGLPSLSAMFERGQIRMPYRAGVDAETSESICSEFNSISFKPDTGKLESTEEHDDTVMSSFFAITSLRESSNQTYKAYLV